jgi:hypothetical protein
LKQSDRFLSHKMFRPRVSSRKTELGPMLWFLKYFRQIFLRNNGVSCLN